MKVNPIFLFIAASLFICCSWDYSESETDYLPVDDSLYPYADVPRLVIETEDFRDIRDKEHKVPAHMQVWEKNAPMGKISRLTIKGRGNSSSVMTKYSYKLELDEKQEFLGMPKNRDWDLISNFRDKSHLRNAITYNLAITLGAPYAPRFRFVELYINREYKGLYMLTEHMKVGEQRINIPDSGYSFFVEKTSPKADEQIDFTKLEEGKSYDEDIIFITRGNTTFKVRSPKNPDKETVQVIHDHFSDFEDFMMRDSFTSQPLDSLSKWIDVQDFIRYYWIQEFSKNIDGAFRRSIYLTWQLGEPIQMGPVWDFDLGYGIGNTSMMSPCDWYVRTQSWYKLLFKNTVFKREAQRYWKNNSHFFAALRDSIDKVYPTIINAVQNDEKRWPVLENDEDWPFVDTYPSYEIAIDSLKTWVGNRVDWISGHI